MFSLNTTVNLFDKAFSKHHFFTPLLCTQACFCELQSDSLLAILAQRCLTEHSCHVGLLGYKRMHKFFVSLHAVELGESLATEMANKWFLS